jgi:hypothetical protein
MSCIWSYVFCMQLFKQKGKGSHLSKYTTQYFLYRDYLKFDNIKERDEFFLYEVRKYEVCLSLTFCKFVASKIKNRTVV